MANYDQPDYVEKRPRYFDGQFLVDQDFIDEQKYHLDRARRHSALLHVSGIAEGLTISPGSDFKITVESGVAVDGAGRQVVVAADQTVDLKSFASGATTKVDLLLAYQRAAADIQQEQGSADYTRWDERPFIQAVAAGQAVYAPSPDELKGRFEGQYLPIPLARLTVTTQGIEVDNSVRQYSGLRLPGPAAASPTLRAGVNGRAEFSEELRIRKALLVDGGLGIGTTEPKQKLHVVGPILADEDGQLKDWLELWPTDSALIAKSDNPIRFGHASQPNAQDWSEKLRIGTNGNVGIGTPDPKARLQIKQLTVLDEGATANGAWANVGSNAYYDGTWKRVDPTKAGVSLHLNADGDGQEFRFWRVEADGSNPRNIAFIGSQQTRFESALEVASKLTVTGTGTALTLAATQIGKLTNIYGALAAWDSDSIFVGVKNEGSNRKDSIIAFGDDPEESLRILFAKHDADAKDLLRVTSGGNIGIGALNPEGGLDIHKGNAEAQASLDATGAFSYGSEKADLVLTRRHGAKENIDGYPASLIDFRATNAEPKEWSVAQILGVVDLNKGSYAGGLAFLTSAGGTTDPAASRRQSGAAPLTRMVIDANGYVGIGTTSPKAMLQVSNGAIMPAVGNKETAGIMFPKDPGGGSGDAAWLRYYVSSGEAATLELAIGNDNNDNLVLKASGKVEVDSDLKVTGKQNLIKSWTKILAIKNKGEGTAGEWSVDYSSAGFTEVYTAFAVLQGFSAYGNENNTDFSSWGHSQSDGSIPQHVYVRLTEYNTKTAKGYTFCSESDADKESDNTVLFSVIVLGRTA